MSSHLFGFGQKVRIIIFYFFVLFFSYLTSTMLLKVAQNITLGSMVLLFIYCLTMAFSLIIINNLEVDHIRKVLTFSQIPSLNYFFTLMALTGIAPSLMIMFKHSQFVSVVSLFVSGSFIFSVYLILNNKLFNSLLIFLINLPFLRLLEWNLDKIDLKWVTVGPLVLTPTIIFLLSIFLAYLLSDKKSEHIELSGIQISIMLFMSAAVVSLFVSNDICLSSRQLLLDMSFPLMFFYLLIKGLKNNIEQVRILLYILIITGFVYIFMGYYFYLGMTIPSLGLLYSIYGLYGMVSQFRIMATFIFPFTVAMALIETGAKRACFILAAFLGLCFVAVSFSRIAVLGAVFSLIPFLRKKEVIAPILAGIILVVIFQGWFMENIFLRFNEFDMLEKLDMSYWSPMRLWGARAAFSIIREHPLFGIGYGMWNDYYYKYGPALYMGKDIYYITSAHNSFLDSAVQGGVLLLMGLTGFLWKFISSCMSLIYFSDNKFTKTVSLGLLGFMIAIITASFAGNVFSISLKDDLTGGIVFWSIVAILVALRSIEKSAKCNTACPQ